MPAASEEFLDHKNVRAEILTIGAELLKGETLNTNAFFLGRELTALGFRVIAQTACRDIEREIRDCLDASLRRSDLLILSGGLGPTPDDVTRDAVANYFGVPLKFSPTQFRRISRLYQFHGKRVPRIVRREAMFPANAEPLINRHGVALGFLIRHGSGLVIVLPGVPTELEKMFQELVGPILRRQFPRMRPRASLRFNMVGISEPEVMRRLGKDFFDEPIDFGIYPSVGEVTVMIQGNTSRIIHTLTQKVKQRLSAFIFGWDKTTLSEAIGKLLLKHRQSLAIAESCTGGLLSYAITKNAGSSRYFKGSVTAYENEIKIKLAGVRPETLKRYGAVSKETAQELARNIRSRMSATYGLSVTGIAGPTGGSTAKPVGTVFISLSGPDGTQTWKESFEGDRLRIQQRTAMKALGHLWRKIR